MPCGYCGSHGFILDSAEYKNPSSDSSLILRHPSYLPTVNVVSGVAFLFPRKQNQISALNMNSEDNNDTNHAAQSSAKLSPSTSPDPPPFSLIHEIAFVATVSCAQLMTQAALGQAIATLHIIGDSFGTQNNGQLSWFAAGYSLTVGTFILITGRLGDMYGHKKLFMSSFVWFSVWSLLTGLSVYSSSKICFDICRAFQGIGPATVLPNGLALLETTYPAGRRKDMVFSIFGATAPSGFLVGALFSSIFAQLAWWPWSYWSMAIACFSIALVSYIVIPSPPPTNTDGLKKEHHFDFAGSVAGISGLVMVNFAWNQGPIVGWGEPYVYVLLIVGILFLVAFIFIEHRVVRPLLPPGILNGETGFTLACIAGGWGSFGIWVYYVWQFMEVLRGSSPLSSTAQYVPIGISGFCAAVTTGFLLSRVRSSYIMLASMTAFTVGTILVATTPVEQTYWAQLFVAIIIMPWGMDMSFPAATVILSNNVPKEHQGMAASLVSSYGCQLFHFDWTWNSGHG